MKILLYCLALVCGIFAHAQKPELMVQSGMGGRISAFAYSENKRFVLMASTNKTLKLIDLQQGRIIYTATLGYPAFSIAFSAPDKAVLLTDWGGIYEFHFGEDSKRCKLIQLPGKHIPSRYLQSNEYGDPEFELDISAAFAVCKWKDYLYFISVADGSVLHKTNCDGKYDYQEGRLVYTHGDSLHTAHVVMSGTFHYREESKWKLKDLLYDTPEYSVHNLGSFGKIDEMLHRIIISENASNFSMIFNRGDNDWQMGDSTDEHLIRSNGSALISFSYDSAKVIWEKELWSEFPVMDMRSVDGRAPAFLKLSNGMDLLLRQDSSGVDTLFYGMHAPGQNDQYYVSHGIFYSDISGYDKFMEARNWSKSIFTDARHAIVLDPQNGLNSVELSRAIIENKINTTSDVQHNLYFLDTDKNGRILFSGMRGNIYIHDPETGLQNWSPDPNMQVMGAKLDPIDGGIWVHVWEMGEFRKILETGRAVSENNAVWLENSYEIFASIYKIKNNGADFDISMENSVRIELSSAILTNPENHVEDLFIYRDVKDGSIRAGMHKKYCIVGGIKEKRSYTNKRNSIAKTSFWESDSTFLNASKKKITGRVDGKKIKSRLRGHKPSSLSLDKSGNPIALRDMWTFQVQSLNDKKVLAKFTPCELAKFLLSKTWYQNRYVLIGSTDGQLLFWDLETKQIAYRYYLLDPTHWALVSEKGLFDFEGDPGLLHFVIKDSQDMQEPIKVIGLDQLKHRYFQPGLMHLFTDQGLDLREVPEFDKVELPPGIELQIEGTVIRVKVFTKGGGIGRIQMFVDGMELDDSLNVERPRYNDGAEVSAEFFVELQLYDQKIFRNGENKISFRAWNYEGWLPGAPVEISYFHGTDRKGGELVPIGKAAEYAKIHLYGLVVGVSDYSGTGIDLKYAAKDAEDFYNALLPSAGLLFEGRTHMQLLNSGAAEGQLPFRKNILAALDSLKRSGPDDIVVIYLSGHGINYGGQDGDFYYLTAEATSAGSEYARDPAIRESTMISSALLTQYLNQVPARKKVLILDACASGKAAEVMLTESKDIPASQVRAIERMKDRTGFHILAGSAADAPSYEASVYGQGLLTYALLKAMKGAKLRLDADGEFVDVVTLFKYAEDEVPILAKGIGGIQKPRGPGASGDQRSFDIGKMDGKIKSEIKISEPKPVFLAGNLTNSDPAIVYDNFGLTELLNVLLMEISTKGKFAEMLYTEARSYPGAYKVAGSYTEDGEELVLNFRVLHDGQLMPVISLRWNKNDKQGLVAEILKRARASIN